MTYHGCLAVAAERNVILSFLCYVCDCTTSTRDVLYAWKEHSAASLPATTADIDVICQGLEIVRLAEHLQKENEELPVAYTRCQCRHGLWFATSVRTK